MKRFPNLPATLLFLTISCLVGAPNVRATSTAREWNEQLLAAIRINLPNPPGHARNLFHLAVAMYDSWAAYDATAVGYAYNEKISPLPGDVEAARSEAISYAAYRVIRARFVTAVPTPTGSATTSTNIDNKLIALYGAGAPALAQSAVTNSTVPAELGKRIGQAILDWGSRDGFGLREDGVTQGSAWPQPYTSAINSNLSTSPVSKILNVTGHNGLMVLNQPLGYGIPSGTDPNLWQPLALSVSVSQNGITQGGIQSFVGVQGLSTTAFSLTRTDNTKPWLDPFGGPSRLSVLGNPSATDADYRAAVMDVLRFSSKLNDPTLIDTSPAAPGHNNPLGADSGTGFPVNPVTGLPWAATPMVTKGNYGRVLAEFWADGPHSETPPGHWHVLGNQVADNPALVKKIRGIGPTLGELEWDVKMYFAISGATHDAACAAWSLKRYYSGPRPITAIRYLASINDLPLEAGVSEVITNTSSQPGGPHENIYDVTYGITLPGSNYVGQVVVKSWPGEHIDNYVDDPSNNGYPTYLFNDYSIPLSPAPHQNPVTWMLAVDWLPFQRKTFNTPAFPGYISGHSSFSRAAAEALTLLTGSPYFPGGFHHHTFLANTMNIDHGPSTNVDLQWATYYDAADQAGQSRRWGGIHPFEDDYDGRAIGSVVGKSAYVLAEKYWTGAIQNEDMQPAITMLPNGHAKVTWTATRGMYQKVRTCTDLNTWTDSTPYTRVYDSNGVYIDTSPAPGKKFYKIQRSTTGL